MLDEFIDRAWSCFNKMDKKPPDRNLHPSNIVAETLKRRSSMAGPLVLDASIFPDNQVTTGYAGTFLIVLGEPATLGCRIQTTLGECSVSPHYLSPSKSNL